MRRERAHRLACACACRVPPEPAYAHVDPVGELHDIRGRHVDNALSDGLVSCPYCQHEARRVADKTSARRLTRKNSPSTAPSRAHPRKSSPNTTPPPAHPRKNSPNAPENSVFRPFWACRANFFALSLRHGAAGRTFSRTGHSDMVALKPMTPLQPLMQASVKPPSPLLAPQQQPLKPTTPLQPKNARNTPISHPQRRWRFQLKLSLREQRRWRFQLKLSLREQRRRRFQATAHLASGLQLRHQQAPMRPPLRKLACNSIG